MLVDQCLLPRVIPQDFLCPYTELCSCSHKCGMLARKYRLLPAYGEGFFKNYNFDGLSVIVIDSQLKKRLVNRFNYRFGMLQLSYLIEGEHTIKIDDYDTDLVRGQQESCSFYSTNFSGFVNYHQGQNYKEVKIRMSEDFIKKHGLASSYDLEILFGLDNLYKNVSRPLCPKTQTILAEILSDNREGLVKRLFLESKALELLSLQLEDEADSVPKKDPIIKKVYEIKLALSSDLNKTYTIPQLARMTGLNDFTVKKEFKRIFRETPLQYQMRLKIKKAKELLKISDKTIAEIADSIGYKNATHFCAAFKKNEGVSPGKFRAGY